MVLFWEYFIRILIVLGILLVIISENRHPVKTLAWCMILIFAPVAGVILYILFGMDNRHRRLIEPEEYDKLKEMTDRSNAGSIVKSFQGQHKTLQEMLFKANRALMFCGNDMEVFTEFSLMADALIKDIKDARHHVHMLFFKFEDDAAGRRIAEALMSKAGEGVEVRLIYDAAGNLAVPRGFYREMRQKGVQIQAFVRIVLPVLSRDYNSRNHRKIVVVDGKIGYVGGMNIAQRYADGLDWGIWRDTHMRLVGPSVSELQTTFLTDWKFASGVMPDLESLYPEIPICGDKMVQIASGGPMGRWNIMMQAYMSLVERSRSYIYIQSPYFIPPDPILKALQNAALGGVDVRIMIPYRGDKGILPPWASRSYVQDALDAGISIYFYRKGYMHAKTIVCDDALFGIGSTNIDFRGFGQDFEITAFVYDRETAVRQKEVFMRDVEDSECIDAVLWKKRPKRYRARESVARMFSPLL